MLPVTKTRLMIASALALSLALAVPAQARTDAENTHCLALGKAFSKLGATEAEVVQLLKDNMPANSSDDDRKTVADMEDLSKTTTQVGDALQSLFANATPPSQAEVDALDKVPIDELTAQARACIH